MNSAFFTTDVDAANATTVRASDDCPLVLHVRSIAGHGGGPEKTILNSPRFLKSLGYRAACAFLTQPDEAEDLRRRATDAEADLVVIRDGGIFDFRIVFRTVRLCRNLRPAIWHAHEYKSTLLGLIARQFCKMKLVTTAHGWVSMKKRCEQYARLEKRVLRYYDAVLAVSDDIYDECQRWGVSKDRCYLVRNAIDVDDFRRDADPVTARSRFPFTARGFLIGAMGRLAEEKGFDLLIKAVAQLIRRGHDISLWIAGEGDQRESLSRLIWALGVQDRVQLVGHISQPKAFFEALDLFVLSSYREGLPNVVLEAMAMEVPVVSTRVAGVPSLIRDGESGILVPIGSEKALHDAMAALIEDAPLRTMLSASARATLERSFCFKKRMQAVAAVYDAVLSRS